MNDILGYFMHITAPSSCINHNSSSFNCLQQQIKQPITSLNSNLNGMSFIINQLNSQLLSMCKSDASFSNLDVNTTLNIINQIYNSYKPLNKIAKNHHPENVNSLSEFQILYGQFIKHTINCIKNLVLPEDLYIQIYASLTPALCLYLRKISGYDINISPSDFHNLITLNEESVEAVLHFLSEDKFETLIEKLIFQFSSNIKCHSPQDLYQSITELLESIKQLLIPRPQKSDKYKTACHQIEELKYKMTLYCENDISRSLSSILMLISHLESTVKSLRLGYLSKESLKSLIKYISNNQYNFVVDPSEKMSKKFIESVLHLYLQEVRSLHEHKLVADTFAENIEKILNHKIDYHEFLKTVPNYYEMSVINGMSHSFSNFDISTTNQLKNFNDCCNMYIEFLREADDFHKGSKLHYNLMKNLIIAESEVIFTTCINYNDNQNDGEKSNIKVDPILSLINEIITIMNDLAIQKQQKVILTFLIHIFKIIQLAFQSVTNTDEIQIIKDFLTTCIPSFDSIDNIIGIKQKIGDLLALIKIYNHFQNEEYTPKTVDEVFDLREMKENFEITVIRKQRQIPEMILRQLDIILPYKDFPSKYNQFTGMIGGSIQNAFDTFEFDQDLFNISNSLYSIICSQKSRFELDGNFFYNWLKIVFSMFYDEKLKQSNAQAIPKFSEIIPFFDLSFIFSKTILTFDITKIIINQQNQSTANSDTIMKEKSNDDILLESVESLRSYVFSVFETLDFDICALYQKLNDFKEKTKRYLNISFYRRIRDQMDYIELNMIIFSEINYLSSLLSKKYPDEVFDCKPLAYINYALSVYNLLSAISESKCLTDNYRSNFESLKSTTEYIITNIKKTKLYSHELDIILSDIIIPFVSQIHNLIRSFDITSLIDVTYEYVYSVLDYFSSKESDDTITPETLVSILHLNFIAETISPKASIFQNSHSIASIFFTLFNIRQQPPQLIETFEKLKETVLTSFINCNMFNIINFLNHIFLQRFGLVKVHQSESEFGLASNDEESDKLDVFEKYAHLSEIIPKTVDDVYELRLYLQGIMKEEESKNSEFEKVCLDLFEKVKTVISPFVEPDERLTSLKEENLKLRDELRIEESRWKTKTEETEKMFLKTRKNCHKTRSKIESAVLEEKKLTISIEQKRKQLVELQSQINKKEREMAFRNEKTPPEMKQKQKVQFMGTIHALRELVGPTKSDQEQVNELTKKLRDMNEMNEKLKKEIEKIDSQHSTTREDEIELLIMTENNSFASSPNQENVEEENEILENQIAETEASNERIKRKLKKINMFNSKIQNKRPNILSNNLLGNSGGNNGGDNINGNASDSSSSSSFASRGLSFISGPDKALADFLHSSRPYCFNNAQTDYDSFNIFIKSTLERINEMMLKRQHLIEKRDGLPDSDNSAHSPVSVQHEEQENKDNVEGTGN